MTTLKDMLDLLRNSDLIRIRRGKKDIYVGYKGLLAHYDAVMQSEYTAQITRFQCIPEIRHKEYKKRGLMEPIRPDIAPTYSFHDLQMSLYYEIEIEEGGRKE